MTHGTATTTSRSNRDGIALVAVLAFLGIILVLSVALVATMRTERMVSETARDATSARAIAKSAVQTAMADVNQLMNSYTVDVNRVWSTNDTFPVLAQPINIRPGQKGAIITSVADPREPASAITNVTHWVRLLDGDITNWLPRTYIASTNFDFNGTNRAAEAEWVNVRDIAPAFGTNRLIIGRYAYAAFDCTGLLDANLIASVTRSNGMQIGEATSSVPEIDVVSPTAPDDFVVNRAYYHRFDTIGEIGSLNDGDPASNLFAEAQAISINRLSSLVPYSLAHDSGWWDWSATKWRLAGELPSGSQLPESVTNWTEANAETIFTAAGYTDPGEAHEMAECFADYTDTDFIPGGGGAADVNIACNEPIPMINEIITTNHVTITPNGLSFDVQHFIEVQVEVWFPFVPIDNPKHYHVRLNGFTATYVALPLSLGLNVAPNPPPPLPDNSASFTVTNARPFTVVKFQYQSLVGSATSAPTSVRIVPFKDFDVSLIEDEANAVVDRVNGSGAGSFDLALLANNANGWGMRNSTSANDPRVNHDVATWQKVTATWSNLNSNVQAFNLEVTGASPETNQPEEGLDFYVANSNMMEVAELGYIHRQRAWSTINLFEDRGIKLLSWFRDTNWNGKTYTRGLLNPNSCSSGAVAAALFDAPIDRYPSEPSPFHGRVNASEAGKIAASVVAVATNFTLFGSNTFDSAAAWARVPALSQTNDSNYVGLDNGQKEAIIRNSYRLFSANQNLFVIEVIAQTILDRGGTPTTGYGQWDSKEDVISGEKRAVALVWRDPFPGTNSVARHEMFIRDMRYLDE